MRRRERKRGESIDSESSSHLAHSCRLRRCKRRCEKRSHHPTRRRVCRTCLEHAHSLRRHTARISPVDSMDRTREYPRRPVHRRALGRVDCGVRIHCRPLSLRAFVGEAPRRLQLLPRPSLASCVACKLRITCPSWHASADVVICCATSNRELLGRSNEGSQQQLDWIVKTISIIALSVFRAIPLEHFLSHIGGLNFRYSRQTQV
jgi:hypothetical protein